MAGGARRSARKKHKLSLLDLPPAVLHQILAYPEVVSLSNLTISKRLFLPALQALYISVELASPTQVYLFRKALSTSPAYTELVEELVLRGPRKRGRSRPVSPAEDGEAVENDMSEAEEEEGSLYTDTDDEDTVPTREGTPYCRLSTLRNLLRALTRLGTLELVGKLLVCELLIDSYLADDPFPVLRYLKLSLYDKQDYDGPADAGLLPCLFRYLNLQRLTVYRSVNNFPFDFLNLRPAARLPPRSCDLKSADFSLVVYAGPELRTFFSAVRNLTYLYMSPLGVYDGFMRDLALLPPSLKWLGLGFGIFCPTTPSKAKYPKFGEEGDLPLHFPALQHVKLGGDIVSPSTFTALATFPSLRTLSLGQHARISPSSLLDFLSASTTLDRLRIDICECDDRSQRFVGRKARKQPQWPSDEFRYSEAKELVKAAQEKGLAVEGTILCATRQCEGVEHKCARFYK